eukprot:3300328-Prymnesium_polylepis.1
MKHQLPVPALEVMKFLEHDVGLQIDVLTNAGATIPVPLEEKSFLLQNRLHVIVLRSEDPSLDELLGGE